MEQWLLEDPNDTGHDAPTSWAIMGKANIIDIGMAHLQSSNPKYWRIPTSLGSTFFSFDSII